MLNFQLGPVGDSPTLKILRFVVSWLAENYPWLMAPTQMASAKTKQENAKAEILTGIGRQEHAKADLLRIQVRRETQKLEEHNAERRQEIADGQITTDELLERASENLEWLQQELERRGVDIKVVPTGPASSPEPGGAGKT